MKKELIVKDKREFNEIINNKKYWKNKHFVIYIRKRKEDHIRFGLAVGKKIGNAVIRNKLKRQMRNIIINNMLLFSNDYDYIIMVSKQCLIDGYQVMNLSLKNLLQEKVKKWKKISLK